jgi:hypothetical protein
VVKVEDAENRSSGAKARRLLSGIYGTTKVVPFQKQCLNIRFSAACKA